MSNKNKGSTKECTNLTGNQLRAFGAGHSKAAPVIEALSRARAAVIHLEEQPMIEGVLWGLVVVMAFAFAYTMQFTASTRAFGVELSDTDSATGFQDSITPPWQTNLAMLTYIGSFVVIAVMWWQFGWKLGLGSFAVIFFGSMLAKQILPKLDSNHYRTLILRSMSNRYADFVKSGDVARAEAMKHLLEKSGINPDEMGGV